MPSPWLAVEAGTDLLARARQIQRSWDRLLGEGVLCAEHSPEATAGLRPTIVESWRRTLASGLEPIDVLPSIEADPSETRERWLEHPLGLLRHVLAEPLQLLAEETDSLVQVTDASGLTLYLGGAEWLKARAAEMNLIEGARCSETANGTNGVGTALAADHPVQVFAFEHFSYHHREWVCSGAPIHDPVSGRLVGVIDLSSPWRIAHPRSLELVTAAAETTEQCLLQRRRDHDARLRRRYGDLTTRSADLLVNREGYVLIGDNAARSKPLDIPESGGEIAMDDGSLAVAEPLGQGEAYLVRRLASRRAAAAQGEALERAEGRARELARKRAAPSRASDPGRATAVESGLPSSGASERLSAYLEAAIDCVIVADASGRIVEFNPAAEQTFGYSRKEALGRTMAELIVPPSLRERHTAAFARFVKTREGSMLGRRVELTGMRADGTEFPVELALSQVEAEPTLICGALRDISAAKQAANHLRELAEEQAALRQVATLVAYESSPDRLVAAVVDHVARVFDVPLVRLIRYEPTAAIVVGGFSESDDEPFPIGSRWQLDTPGLLATIRHTGHPTRVEDYAQAPGDDAGAVRAAGMRCAVGSPIVVAGRVWGAIVVLSPRSASLPEDTGARLADFTELVATALANAESRAALSQLADEQAALRRVATLVAREASPVELLATVAEEVARVLDVEAIGMLRFEPDATATLVAQSDTPWDPPPLGTRFTLEGENVVTAVFRTREAARLDDWETATGPVATMAHVLGIRSSVATPIVVEGRLWGTLIAVTSQSEPLPRETDSRIGEFTELVATAIANAGARDELSQLVEEQAALGRVATLVAEGAAPTEVFEAVIAEVGQLLGAAQIGLARYENEHEISVLAIRGQSPEILRAGARLPLDGDSVNARILRTGRSARLNFAEQGSGSVAEVLRRDNVNATVGAPIVVDGALWGMIGTSWRGDDQPPADAEERVEKFAELVATAIANTESRAELAASEARARDLAGEQAALRRVATLVAKGASSDELFAAVTRAAADVLDVPVVALQRYEADRMFTMVSIAGETNFTVGSRWPVEDKGLAGIILATGRPARNQDYTTMPGPLGAALRDGGLISAVGVPIVVQGSIWGFMTAGARRGKPTPDGTAERLARFTELVATAIADSQAREQLAQLASEQAALRRVATMVARPPAPEQLFSAIAREVASVLDVPGVIVTRYQPDGSAVTLGEAFGPDLEGAKRFLGVGTPMPPDPGTLTALVFDTHDPARVDDLSTSPGTVGEVARAAELGSGCAGPIVVNGTLWGKMCVFSRVGAVLPAGTENRLHDFIDLIATAISNYEARAELAASEAHARELADEQAALRRVATLVAREPASEAFFSAVAREVASVLNVPGALVERFEADGASVSVGAAYDSDLSGAERLLGVGVRTPPDSGSLTGQVFETKRPARVDDFSTLPGPVGDAARAAGIGSGSAGPIVVNRGLWGMLAVFSRAGTQLPAGTENRLHDFIELVATAISNYEARAALAASEARARELAGEQAALRRVATLVARGVSPQEIFSAVTNEMGRLFDSSQACVGRFEPDGSAMVVVGVSDGTRGISTGSRWELESYMASTGVYRTGRPVRVERSDLEHVSGPMADVLREIGAVSNVGAPIVVEGKQWGFVTVTGVNKRLPADAEKRLEQFAELLGTAIANADSRAELAASEARARDLAREQAALRRVATLVAKGAKSEALFSAVAHEVAHVFGVQHVTVCRYERDTILVLSSFEAPEAAAPPPFRAGRRLPLDVPSLPASVHRTGEPTRIDEFTASDGLYGVARQAGLTAAIGVPIVVDGTVWGAVNIGSTKNERFLSDAEERLARFTDLVATSVSNATMREELAASRARIIAAGDDARRRIERDLHDGAQQRLITLTVALRRADAKLPAGADELRADLTRVAEGLTTAVDELRELSQGIHPSILTEGGLSPALKALGRRSPVRVKLDMGVERRLADHVEVAAYYTVSEALTNASKHANATRVWVSLRVDHDVLRLSIRDDGVGGADANRGSGLTGLRDRIEALGGRIQLESPTGRGTLIKVEIPIGGPADRNDEPDALLAQVTTSGSPG
jgi:PAS domain S-box-containing protein